MDDDFKKRRLIEIQKLKAALDVARDYNAIALIRNLEDEIRFVEVYWDEKDEKPVKNIYIKVTSDGKTIHETMFANLSSRLKSLGYLL